ncbi:MAG: hypothetical protein IJM17_09075 [Firmicutes bacterium]|nr:hypothetical protein [Bacillota bacterium]
MDERTVIRIEPDPTYRVPRRIVITPDPDYRARAPLRILPDSDYRPPSLHALETDSPGLVRNVRARWCPVCHSSGSDITETVTADGPRWVCGVCHHSW